MANEPAGAAPVADAAAASAAGAADTDTSLLNPSHDDTKTGGVGGSDPNANADGKPKAGAPDPAKPAGDQKGAPEKYADYTIPQGVKLDPAVVTEFNTVAKKFNLTQEQAQEFITLQSKVALQTTEQSLKEYNAIKKGWEDETVKAYGDKYLAERAFVAKARDKFVTPELQALFDKSGFGSHPEVFRMFATLGKAISEDSLTEGKHAGDGAGDKLKSTAEVLYSGPKK